MLEHSNHEKNIVTLYILLTSVKSTWTLYWVLRVVKQSKKK